ncbi:hypothetical protein LTR48_009101, partial [Friedmanniomyces endolithicus]
PGGGRWVAADRGRPSRVEMGWRRRLPCRKHRRSLQALEIHRRRPERLRGDLYPPQQLPRPQPPPRPPPTPTTQSPSLGRPPPHPRPPEPRTLDLGPNAPAHPLLPRRRKPHPAHRRARRRRAQTRQASGPGTTLPPSRPPPRPLPFPGHLHTHERFRL